MAETADIGRRTYYLEVLKLIFGSTWFGWIVAALIAAVHFGPPYLESAVSALSFAKPQAAKTEVKKISLSPTMEELHDRVLRMEGDIKLVADWVAAQQMRIPGRAKGK